MKTDGLIAIILVLMINVISSINIIENKYVRLSH